MAPTGVKVVASNRRARHDYAILETLEAGLVLRGGEVKSLRAGHVQLADAYAYVKGHECWLEGVHIAPYAFRQASTRPSRPSAQGTHARAGDRGARPAHRERLTLVPLSIYFRDGRAKVELGLARGRRKGDQRQAIARHGAARRPRRSDASARAWTETLSSLARAGGPVACSDARFCVALARPGHWVEHQQEENPCRRSTTGRSRRFNRTNRCPAGVRWRPSRRTEADILQEFADFGSDGAQEPECQALAQRLSLNIMPEACRTTAGWVQLVAGGAVTVGIPDHFIVVSGIYVDDEGNAQVHVLDPANGDSWQVLETVENGYEEDWNFSYDLLQK